MIQRWTRTVVSVTRRSAAVRCEASPPECRNAAGRSAVSLSGSRRRETLAATRAEQPFHDVQPPATNIAARSPFRRIASVSPSCEVYRARDTKLNRDVAVKILPEAFASDPDRLARFRREAQVLASLNHPNNRAHLRRGGQWRGSGLGARHIHGLSQHDRRWAGADVLARRPLDRLPVERGRRRLRCVRASVPRSRRRQMARVHGRRHRAPLVGDRARTAVPEPGQGDGPPPARSLATRCAWTHLRSGRRRTIGFVDHRGAISTRTANGSRSSPPRTRAPSSGTQVVFLFNCFDYLRKIAPGRK
jgi:hypothetical protein